MKPTSPLPSCPHLRLAAFAALTVLVVALAGCGKDATSPAEVLELATLTVDSGYGGAGTRAAPRDLEIEFGVQSDPPDNSSDYPSPLIFGDIVMSQVGQSYVLPLDGSADAATVAARLTDGVDESIWLGVAVDGVSSFGTGSRESTGFDYTQPDLGHPDFAGYDLTTMVVTLDDLTLTQAADHYTVHVAATISIRGTKKP